MDRQNQPYFRPLLAHLHEMKAAYQPNMLKAMLMLIILAGVISSWLLYCHQTSIPGSEKLPDCEFGMPESSIGGNQSSYGNQDSPLTVLRGLLNYAHDGFAGFNGYKIKKPNYRSPDIAISKNLKRLMHERTTEYPEIISVLPLAGETYGSGDGVGGVGDFGLPRGESLIEIAYNRFPQIIPPEVHPPGKSEPAYIRFTNHLRYPASAVFDTGVVILEFIITRNGNVKDRTLISETPPGMGVARAVLDVLNEAAYFPAKAYGQKIDSKVCLVWTICYQCKEQVLSSENLVLLRD